MRFEISWSAPFRWLATITGTGPNKRGMTVADDHIEVRFRARIPRSAITAVEEPVRIPALFGFSVHGWNGRWVVNGSQQGTVRLTIAPAGTGRVLLVPVTLRELYVSLEQPAAFAAAVQPA